MVKASIKARVEVKVEVPANSCYFMTGKSRYDYKHGFKEGGIVGHRISCTFRTVKDIFRHGNGKKGVMLKPNGERKEGTSYYSR